MLVARLRRCAFYIALRDVLRKLRDFFLLMFDLAVMLVARLRRSAFYFALRDILCTLRSFSFYGLIDLLYYMRGCAAARFILRCAMYCACCAIFVFMV